MMYFNIFHFRFLCCLRFFATGSYQRSVGSDALSCMSQTSVSRCIHEISNAINALASKYVYMPTDHEVEDIKQKFYNIASFPGIVGLIDGTHIKIKSPGEPTEQAYYCRKGGHSINVLIMCDSNNIIRYANTKFPGTTHDAYIWRRSALLNYYKEKYNNGERNFWLLGDSGFPLQPWLMTPFGAPASRSEQMFNTAHKSTRCMVERCIGVLKSRFRCILSERILSYDPVISGKIINACIILHNYMQFAGVLPPQNIDEPIVHDIYQPNQDAGANDMLSHGRRTRQDIVNNNF